MLIEEKDGNQLLIEISGYIQDSKNYIAGVANHTLTMLYWKIGSAINKEILGEERAIYGKQIVATLSRELTKQHGNSFEEKSLWRMIQFATVFPEEQIVATLSRQLSWSHFKDLIPVTDALKRDFYVEMCRLERWTIRQLRERMKSMLFERTAISKKPEETIRKDLDLLRNEQQLSPELVFRDPYVLDFLGLKDVYSEKDLESSILTELQRFITELGSDFAFLSRQRRISIDNRDYYIDLLFYHRRLRSLVVIDLKLGEFEAAHKGQMELYLRYLEKQEMMEGENTPVGLILCAGKNEEHIELLRLNESNIKVSEYLTKLPSKEILQRKLHQAIEIAHNRLKENPNKNE